MDPRINLERSKNYLYEDQSCDIFRFDLFYAHGLTQAARSIRTLGNKSWYPHLFNTRANMNYVGSIPDMSQYGVAEMSESEREEFTSWYDAQKHKVFDNRDVLEQYC